MALSGSCWASFPPIKFLICGPTIILVLFCWASSSTAASSFQTTSPSFRRPRRGSTTRLAFLSHPLSVESGVVQRRTARRLSRLVQPPPPRQSLIRQQQHDWYPSSTSSSRLSLSSSSSDDLNESQEQQQQQEAWQSLTDFHQGRWKGVAVHSFTVTNDAAAGIGQRQHYNNNNHPEDDDINKNYYYVTTVHLGDSATLTETLEWQNSRADEELLPTATALSKRTVSLRDCRMDVDSVDASYSLDTLLQSSSSSSWLPSVLTGPLISNTAAESTTPVAVVEHCIATSDDARTRCFVYYQEEDTSADVATATATKSRGGDWQAPALSRIVICHEERITQEHDSNDDDRLLLLLFPPSSRSEPSATDFVAMERDRRFARNDNAASSSHALSLHTTTSLLELSSGVWCGDAVIRDVELSTLQTNPTSAMRRRGFGTTPRATGSSSKTTTTTTAEAAPPFASWQIGVQKMTRQWVWNLGDQVRHIRERGRSLGVALAPTLAPTTLIGSVCVNESNLSAQRRSQRRRRGIRTPPEERMVYVDWESSGYVGFLISATAIQVPRYLKVDRFGQMRPFYTEFSVFQVTGGNRSSESGSPELPEVVCSTICRVYGENRRLQQGVSSFSTLKRFGESDADESDFR